MNHAVSGPVGDPTIDPVRTITETLEKLGPPSGRHVVFLLGAGASMAAGLPGLGQLQQLVTETLDGADREIWERLSANRNLEQVLSYLRALPAVLGPDDALDGVTPQIATQLDRRICGVIVGGVAMDPPNGMEAHDRFARWLGRSDYREPVEVYTTNYDTIIERALEAEAVPYFDGFVGHIEARFRTDLVDAEAPSMRSIPPPGWVRLWKLHGSVDWAVTKEGDAAAVRRVARATGNELAAAIYPSVEKYEESRRLPFVALADRLRRSLAAPESVTMSIGYSYGDEHVNEVLFDSVARFPRSEIVALSHSAPSNALVVNAKRYPNLTVLAPTRAIIGTKEYEYEEAPAAPGWTGTALELGSFATFTEVLSGS